MVGLLLFPSLLASADLPWRASEAELAVLETVSEADLAMFLIEESMSDGQ